MYIYIYVVCGEYILYSIVLLALICTGILLGVFIMSGAVMVIITGSRAQDVRLRTGVLARNIPEDRVSLI